MQQFTFHDCSDRVDVVFGDSLESIGDSAFTKCSSLGPRVIFPDKLAKIGEDAFHSCTALESIEWGKYLTTLGDSAFYLTALKTLILPEKLTVLAFAVFAANLYLERVVVTNKTNPLNSALPHFRAAGYSNTSSCHQPR